MRPFVGMWNDIMVYCHQPHTAVSLLMYAVLHNYNCWFVWQPTLMLSLWQTRVETRKIMHGWTSFFRTRIPARFNICNPFYSIKKPVIEQVLDLKIIDEIWPRFMHDQIDVLPRFMHDQIDVLPRFMHDQIDVFKITRGYEKLNKENILFVKLKKGSRTSWHSRSDVYKHNFSQQVYIII